MRLGEEIRQVRMPNEALVALAGGRRGPMLRAMLQCTKIPATVCGMQQSGDLPLQGIQNPGGSRHEQRIRIRYQAV